MVNNIGDFGVFNGRELATKPAAWSLAAWYYLSNPDMDFKPSTFKQQLDSVNQNSKIELDTLNNLGKQDPEVQKVIDSMNIPTYDTLNQKIDSSIQQKFIETILKINPACNFALVVIDNHKENDIGILKTDHCLYIKLNIEQSPKTDWQRNYLDWENIFSEIEKIYNL